MSWLRDWLRSRTSGGGRRARFALWYSPTSHDRVKVGHLSFDGTEWAFEYDADFKDHDELRPLENFEDLERVYRSRRLFPFFAVWLPYAQRLALQDILSRERVDGGDLVGLLRLFGRKVASSPDLSLVET